MNLLANTITADMGLIPGLALVGPAMGLPLLGLDGIRQHHERGGVHRAALEGDAPRRAGGVSSGPKRPRPAAFRRSDAMTINVVFLAAVCGLVIGCDRGHAPPPAARPSTTATADAPADERLAIIEAVFRYQFDKNASGGQRKVDYFFLALGDETDPPAELLARFADEKPTVLPVSLAESSAASGVRHKTLGGRGLIFTVGNINRIDADTADVGGGYYEGGLSASGNTYHLKRVGGRWKVESDTIHWIS